MLDLRNLTVLVTGGSGFIGHSVVKNLIEKRGLTPNQIIIPDSKRDDLSHQSNCARLFSEHKIDVVIHLAARLGGVGYSSSFPAMQYYQNILMDLQIMETAKNANVKKIVMVSSACAYPKNTTYPLTEENLWSGLPQETNLAYGVGKRLMTVQASAYREQYGTNAVVVIPNNAYGPGDSFHPEYSHVIPSLIQKCLRGDDPLIVWGDGTPTRDFFYVDDFAEGVILAAEQLESSEPINLGSGTETSIKELVDFIRSLTGHTGTVAYDTSQPNGQARRSVDTSKAEKILGFKAVTSLEVGLRATIEWYKVNRDSLHYS